MTNKKMVYTTNVRFVGSSIKFKIKIKLKNIVVIIKIKTSNILEEERFRFQLKSIL